MMAARREGQGRGRQGARARDQRPAGLAVLAPSARQPIPSCTTSCCARRTCRPTPRPWATTRTTTPRCVAGARPRDFEAEGIEMQAALGPGRRPAHARARARREAGCQPLRTCCGGPGRPPGARASSTSWPTRTPAAATPSGGARRMANANTLTGTGQLPKFEDDLFKTTRGPLPHSHGRGAADQHPLPARCSTPIRPAASLLRVHPVLPRGGGQRRSRHARPHPCAPVRQGGDGQVRQARGKLRRAGVHGRRRREHPAAAGACPIA